MTVISHYAEITYIINDFIFIVHNLFVFMRLTLTSMICGALFVLLDKYNIITYQIS